MLSILSSLIYSFRTARASRLNWIALTTLITLGVVGAEYALNGLLNPEIDWSYTGVFAHALLDVGMMWPVVALALGLGVAISRRLGLSLGEGSGVLGTIGVLAIVLFALVLPLNTVRDIPHESFGQAYGFSLAETQTTVVTSELTVQEKTQLCSLSAVRRGGTDENAGFLSTLPTRAEIGARDSFVQLALFLPLLVLGLLGLFREQLPTAESYAPAVELARMGARHWRFAALSAASLLVLLVGFTIGGEDSPGVAEARGDRSSFNACTDGGPVKTYDVSAIDVQVTLNRWGDHVDNAHMYALNANIPAIRAFEAALEADRAMPDSLTTTRVSYGLRDDLIQPLVIRANLGECLRINFTNTLDDGDPASLHILGLPHTVDNAGSAVGNNPDTMADSGQTITYEIPIPLVADAERSYYFHDHGAGRRRQNMGLFGAIVAEPEGATYLDVETGQPLDTVTGSNWEAIIIDPNADGSPDGKSFREFVLMYHEIGDEAFTDIQDREDKKLPLVDELAGVYRPAARAINYRSEPFRNRIDLDEQTNGEIAGNGKSLGYASYPFGDPATPIPRSYVGEAVKTRLMHGGSEVFHVHHLHGGGDRWRRNPNADPNNDYWKGLTKVPDPNLTSIHLDSQSIGPGSSYNLEHECGAGGCQQSVGDFLFHCHIGHHYIAGMWSFWRVFGTEQTIATNMYERPLAVVEQLFQADNVFSDAEATSNTPPDLGVSAGQLIGTLVDDGRMIVADADVVDPMTQVGVLDWITDMLPPAGLPIDKNDATVWNWTSTGAGASLQVFGEPESASPFPGWVSPTPGVRPEVLFNPKNARYTWPLFRPQIASRPPFSARHGGAPWLGEEMKAGRMDGLCAKNGVHPNVDVGDVVNRYYPVSAITLPVQVTSDNVDADGKIFVLNEDEDAIRSGAKPAEPLAIRSNVGDCTELIFTNKIPDRADNKFFSKQNIHNHFLQFDPQASDGVISGMSYEQSVHPYEEEDRTLLASTPVGATTLSVSNTDRLRPGIWLGVGLGEATCGTDADGQPLPCTEVRKIVSIPDANTVVLDEPLVNAHAGGEAVGVEFVRYKFFADVDFGTVFFHTHVEFKDWDNGLFGAHIVEPKGSTYHDPRTGEEVRAGTLVDVRTDPNAGGNPVAFGVEGSFREFMLFLQNNNPVEGRFTQGGGTINLRAEPWRLRDTPGNDPAYRFSSVLHNDPHTQEINTYVGDPVVIRGMGLTERVGGVRFAGHRFNTERYTNRSDTRDAQYIGISERFDVSLEGGAGGPDGYPGDYLYYSTLGRDFESGAWGLLRVGDSLRPGLQPLPDRPAPPGGGGFPDLSFTGSPPPSLDDGPGDACPPNAPVREYSIALTDASIVYNDLALPDVSGVVYQPQDDITSDVRTPLVMRANVGECLRVNLRNDRAERGSLSIGELIADPQRSASSAIGFNFDSTVAPGEERTYELFADRVLGLVTAVNLGDAESIERGAFAGVVIEPQGAEYFRPNTNQPLPQGGIGIQADIKLPSGVKGREFVALIHDEDRRIGQNDMPYPVDVDGFSGLSYSAEPLDIRGVLANPADVFKTSLWGDPRHVVEMPAGAPFIMRVGQPWGNQVHLPTLEGHRYLLEPRLAGSEQVFNQVLAPGMNLNMRFVGGAGGDIQAPGDYLFLDRRQPFLEHGLWGILRVTDGVPQSRDQIRITDSIQYADGENNRLSIEGINGIRAAGDTARTVTVRAGGIEDGRCTGRVLGRTRVDSGNGRWHFDRPIAGDVPSEVCISSPGGGVRVVQP